MLKFLTLKPEAFGLDFSDLSLKIAKLKKKGKFLSLASWGKIEIKPGIIEKGEIKNEAALAKIIKDGLGKIKGEKIRSKYVIASLPENKAFIQVIKMPRMKEEELKTAVPFEAENYIPLPIEEAYLDFQILSPLHNHLDHLDILIAALPKKTIDSYVSCLKKAALIPLALVVESKSIARALIKNRVSPFPVFIIDFGESNTNFIIFSGYSLRFTSSIPISSQKLTEAIANVLKVDLDEAEKLKIEHGLIVKKRSSESQKKVIGSEKIFEAMAPILNDLVEQTKRYIRYYYTHVSEGYPSPKDRKIKKILLCGRGSNLKGLTGFLSNEFKIPVEPGNPWINILPQPLKEVPELPFKESLGYTTALGLALKGIQK